MSTVKVVPAECHAECLDVIGPNEHVANVNPIGFTDPTLWRVDCDSCCTCVRAGFKTRDEAQTYAEQHVARSSKEFWREMDN